MFTGMKKQNSNLFYVVLIFTALHHIHADAQNKALPKPNILMLVSEDNSPYFGVYGDKVARTPNVELGSYTV